jgi:transcription elongation factor GreA
MLAVAKILKNQYNYKMRTPIRKPGKYTHLKPDPNLTEEKYNELQEKLEKLKKFSRPNAAVEVRRLAEMGDFSENAAYQIAKGRLRGINQRILDIEDHLKRAVIIKPSNNINKVQLGCKVTVEANNKLKTYLILGSAETNPAEGIISHNSPLGSALMGRKIGDMIKVELSNKEVEYKIVEIE